ncbi:SDR family oxidoreductase [Portibacter lacus]|uniref:Oxidoreductase n=1 Tax=Portibacter lacus TaxID=1099794 RepID=A0AA37SWW8_9BACT|nr:SDR family oxidoreductase [Portibacter lacus]GLR19145.1 oxidoreductase [Portibacter lacus]
MNAVITGGTKGIGKAIASLLAEQGANLAICSRNGEELATMKKEFEQKYPKIDFIITETDVSKKNEVEKFAAEILSKWSRIDMLVNNAGVFLPGEIHQEEEGKLESQIETNLYSAYHLTRALMPTFLNQNQGHIFNMCSVASLIAYPNGGSYSISKFALLGFSKVLREELKDKGIKVTAVMPGATWSNSWAGVELPEERLMKADDIAQAIWSAYNLSPAAVVEEIILRPQKGDL